MRIAKTNNSHNPAILLGGDSVNALAVARNLGRYGIKNLYVSEKRNEAFFSRYIQRHFVVQDIERNGEVLKSFLSEISKQVKKRAVIFPNSDLFCLGLSRARETLIYVRGITCDMFLF